MTRLPRRTRRLGIACFAVAVGVSVLTLMLGHYAGAAVSAGVGVSSLLLTLAADDRGRTEHALMVPVANIADQLADTVHAQWQKEARVHRLNDPYPLRVSWEAATDLAEDWQDILDNAKRWPDASPDRWATKPEFLTAKDGDLARILDKVPTGRLIVLGKPGSGKTMLLVRLVLDLLAPGCRASGTRVPVLLSVASWNPTQQDLHSWLADQLILNYSWLGEPAQSVGGNLSRAQALLSKQLLLPVLDGLDEIPKAVRRSAIDKINEALRSGDRLVISCRTKVYRAIARPSGGRAVKVRGAAAVVLHSLEPMTIRQYLVDDVRDPCAARWEPVLAALGPEAGDGAAPPIAQAFSTPLAVGLARSIYNPRQDGQPPSLPDPAELCDTSRFPCRKDIEKYLFKAFIAAAYRPGREHSPRCVWTALQAEQYLSTLARRHLQDKKAGKTEIKWWRMPGSKGPTPTRGLQWSLTELNKAWLAAIMLTGGLLFGLTISPGVGLSVALGSGLVLVMATGLGPAPTDLNAANGPNAVLARDRGTFLTISFIVGPLLGLAVDIIVYLSVGPAHTRIGPGIGLRTGLVVGPAAFAVFTAFFGLVYGAMSGLLIGIIDWLVSLLLGQFVGGLTALLVSGALIGAIAGMLFGLRKAPWGAFTAMRCWLAMRQQLPWNLMAFLADAHQRAVLRQIGVAYQFRHHQLQEFLAARPGPSGPEPVPEQEADIQ